MGGAGGGGRLGPRRLRLRGPTLTTGTLNRGGGLLAATVSGSAGELAEELARGGGVRIERIVSHGDRSPEGFWYDQEEREWVALLAGRARLAFADPDERIELAPGDWVDIPAHRRHRVEWTDPAAETIWLAVFYPAPK